MWLRRRDKLRQAISWWRAATTGQYALVPGQVAAEPPEFDRDGIGRLLWLAQASEAGWRDWFAAHSIEPLQIVYEDLVQDVDGAARSVAGFLDVPLPPGLEQIRLRLRRQADHHTELLVRLFSQHGGA